MTKTTSKPLLTKFFEHPDKVEAYKQGKTGLLGMFMGQIMKKSGGKADPKQTSILLREKLS